MTVIAGLSLTVAYIVLRYLANWAHLDNVFKTDVPLDLWIYMRGGERVAEGINLYQDPIYFSLPFTYPPFSGLIFAWVSLLDDVTVTAIWHTLTVAGVILVVWFCLRRLRIDVNPNSFLLILPLLAGVFLLGAEPLHATLFWGQINVLLMVLVCLDFLPLKHRLPGIGVGLAAGIKLTPAFFGILFLIQRRWWAALGSFLTFLGTVVVGFLVVPDAKNFWTDAIFKSNRVGDHTNPGAQSLKSVLVRHLGVESSAVWLVLLLLTIALVAVAATLAVKRDNIPLAVGFTGFGACLVSPFSWYHHWVWIVPVAIGVFVGVNQAVATWANGNMARWQVAGLLSVGALVLTCVPFLATNVTANLFYDVHPGMESAILMVPGSYALLVGYVAYALVEQRREDRTAKTTRTAKATRTASMNQPSLVELQPHLRQVHSQRFPQHEV